MAHEIHEKWGFGMAPVKPLTQRQRLDAAAYTLKLIGPAADNSAAAERQELLSIVKGLFNRISRGDQWDWFTVRAQLGYPSGSLAKMIADTISRFRRASIDRDEVCFRSALRALRILPVQTCLSIYLGQSKVMDEVDAGWIYVLSTREYRDVLKVGMTTRTVEERVKEINGATGVAIPFGVRGCWRVKHPHRAERLIHERLHSSRMRGDREFFREDFKIASSLIREALTAESLEIRTLKNLAALAKNSMGRTPPLK